MYRRAIDRDGFRWWQLRNDPDALFWSLNKAPIPLAEHDAWFQRVMRSPDHVLMVHTDETLYDLGIPPINAYGRIQIEKRAEVSFGVAPASRGEGIGTGMLQALEGDAVELEVQKLVAYVHPGNTASLRAFMRQGYHIGGYPGMVQVEKPLG